MTEAEIVENGESSEEDQDLKVPDPNANLAKRSLAGIKMANGVAEWCLMRYFFPNMKERKKQ